MTTSIRFDLREATPVTLQVFDVSGRLVATYLNGLRMPPGTHSLQLDAHRFAGGVYFYRLKAGPFIQTRKMVRLK